MASRLGPASDHPLASAPPWHADDFGREPPSVRPLLLDAVISGPRASDSLLFRLPAEILADVVFFLADDARALGSLALVNSDCLALARSCQFTRLRLDTSQTACRIARRLIEEDEAVHAGCSPAVPLGRFVRRAVVLKGFRPDLYTPVESCHRWPAIESAKYRPSQHPDLDCFALALSRSCPHLESLAWNNPLPLGPDFFGFLARAPRLRHFALLDGTLTDGFSLDADTWPLRSLSLQIFRRSQSGAPLQPFFDSLLGRCAPTLEALEWSSVRLDEVFSLQETTACENLRCLDLSRLALSPRPPLDSVLASVHRTLTQLALPDPSANPEMLSRLALCPSLLALRSLILPSLTEQTLAEPLLDFAARHAHLVALSVRTSPAAIMDSLVVPRIVGGESPTFGSLRSLALGWEVEDAAEGNPSTASLAAVGSLGSLERLSLAVADEQETDQALWRVDHDELRQLLAPLTHVRRLALSLDTYPSRFSSSGRDYYAHRVTMDGDLLDATSRPELDGGVQYEDGSETSEDSPESVTGSQEDGEVGETERVPPPPGIVELNLSFSDVWERAHRNRMLAQAERYAAVFPHLEWMFCGQLPMAVGTMSGKRERRAVPLGERDLALNQPMLDAMVGESK